MNWGNKLLTTFIVFGAGMSFLVYKAVTTRFDLVSKEYYKDELAYQQVIDGSNKANALTEQVSISRDENFITIQLPKELNGQTVNGKVWFYCAADASKDRKFDLKPGSDGKQLLELNKFYPVNYKVKIDWESNGEHYYSETDFSNI
jgi:hypothetical protein